MAGLLRAAVKIRGTRPLLWCAFGPDAIPLTPREKTGVAGNDPEEWKRTVLMTKDRQLYVKPTYIFGAVRDGAKNVKKGRGSIQALVASTLQVTESIIPLGLYVPEEPVPQDPEASVYLDISSVRNPNTKARNVRYRIAAAPGWECSFTLEWDPIQVPRDQMKEAVKQAGMFAGLGDGRSIGYGRFVVEEFTVSEVA